MPGKGRNGPGKTTNKYSLGVRTNDGLHDVDLPSGHTVQARRPGVQGLIAAGLLDNFDELTAIVQVEHIEPQTPKGRSASATPKVTPDQAQSAAEVLLKDKEKLATAFHLMDRLAAFVIVQPPVWVDYQGKDEPDGEWEARQAKAAEDGAYAVREIDIEDKTFLLNWAVGGSSDLAAFRQGTNELMGNLATN